MHSSASSIRIFIEVRFLSILFLSRKGMEGRKSPSISTLPLLFHLMSEIQQSSWNETKVQNIYWGNATDLKVFRWKILKAENPSGTSEVWEEL